MNKILILTALLCAAVTASAANRSRDAMLVTTDWLAAHLHDPALVLLHVGDAAHYNAGHIDGARLVPQGGLAAPRGSDAAALILEMPSAGLLRTQLQDLGVSRTSRIVVYYGRDEVPAATRVMFTLDAAGLGARASLLDGGQGQWLREGRATTMDVPPVKTGVLPPLTLEPALADAAFVQKHLADRRVAVIDARAAQFYDGSEAGRFQVGEPKKGHIPGARSIPYDSVTDGELKLKSPEALADLFAKAGVKRGDKAVVYCHVGQQASEVLVGARSLGIVALLYDGSFAEWSQLNLPVETTPAPLR
ncbi:MAG: rhodanese-like domain-containing protein [Burkholderiaceae bacterium]